MSTTRGFLFGTFKWDISEIVKQLKEAEKTSLADADAEADLHGGHSFGHPVKTKRTRRSVDHDATDLIEGADAGIRKEEDDFTPEKLEALKKDKYLYSRTVLRVCCLSFPFSPIGRPLQLSLTLISILFYPQEIPAGMGPLLCCHA